MRVVRRRRFAGQTLLPQTGGLNPRALARRARHCFGEPFVGEADCGAVHGDLGTKIAAPTAVAPAKLREFGLGVSQSPLCTRTGLLELSLPL